MANRSVLGFCLTNHRDKVVEVTMDQGMSPTQEDLRVGIKSQ